MVTSLLSVQVRLVRYVQWLGVTQLDGILVVERVDCYHLQFLYLLLTF